MCTVFPQILALVCKPHNMLIRVTVSRPDVACRNLTQTRRHNVFADCLLETSLCTDVPPPSEKIGRGDVCESPTIIVFPFPRNVGDSL